MDSQQPQQDSAVAEADAATTITLGHATAAHLLAAANADWATYKNQQYCWGWPPLARGAMPGPYWGMTNYYWCCAAVVRWFYIASAGVFDMREHCPNWGAVKYIDAALNSGTLPFKQVASASCREGDWACEFVNGVAQHTYIIAGAVSRGAYPTREGDTSNPRTPSSMSTGGYVNAQSRNLEKYNSAPFTTHVYRPTWYVPPTPPPPPAPPAPPAPSTQLVLRSGMHDPCGSGTTAGSGNHIHALQSGMNKEFPAYPETPLVVDGVYGAHCVAAVEDFQRRARLTVDGIAGPLTIRALLAAGVHV